MARPRSAAERFFEKVVTSDGCWIWTACVNNDGYGGFWDGKRWTAHRWLYERLVGPVPDGLELDHLCRNIRCVRIDHLEPITHQENIVRGVSWAGQNAAKTHCPKGHPYDLLNTLYEGVERVRRCRACVKARWQREEISL